MGYPQRPIELHVVDLPDDLREYALSKDQIKDMQRADGVTTKYVYTGMTDLKSFEPNSFDFVWSGQSIEHVSEQDAETTFAEVLRVLKPGGFFSLDTPNRRLTKLISERYLHADHKLEYTPGLLCEKLKAAGFEIQEVKAITPLPVSASIGRVSKLEFLNAVEVNDDFDNGFSFYVKCVKPFTG